MNLKSILEHERKQVDRFRLLPTSYKKLGLGLMLLALVAMFLLRGLLGPGTIWPALAGKFVLVGMLLIAISRDKEEDEMIAALRSQAFAFSFICGVVYALVQPYINYMVAFVLQEESIRFAELSVPVVLWFMLFVHLAIFTLLKRSR